MKADRPFTTDLGFDTEIARTNLMDWLIDHKHLEEPQVTAWEQSWREPCDLVAFRTALEAQLLPPAQLESTLAEAQRLTEQRVSASDSEVAWAVTHFAATQHGWQHGVPLHAKGQPVCNVWPCAKCGVSFALLELHAFQTEATSSQGALADALAEFERRVRSLNGFASRLTARLYREAERHEGRASMLRVEDVAWRSWLPALSAVGQLESVLPELQTNIREQFRSATIRHATTGKAGRVEHWLLTAVTQHLAKGGFAKEDIVLLVPDNLPGQTGAEERVRKRIEAPDCRTVLPWEPDPPKNPENGRKQTGG